MTALDPRVGEIEGRLAAATPGPWAFDGTEIDTVPDPEGDNPWKSVMECRVDCMSYCYGGSVAMDIGSDDRALIEAAPTDLAYLLAELRKAHEALADAGAKALEDAADELARLPYVKPGAPGRDEYEMVLAVRRGMADAWLKNRAKDLRAAVAAANGDGRG